MSLKGIRKGFVRGGGGRRDLDVGTIRHKKVATKDEEASQGRLPKVVHESVLGDME